MRTTCTRLFLLVAFGLVLPLTALAQDPYAGQPLGQCLTDGDCAPGLICSAGAPGGICVGCTLDDQCIDSVCSPFGSCARDCADDLDCPPGLSCAANGLCRILSCSESCAVPLYGCSATSQCERVACPASPCPADTTCQNGFCMENRQIPAAVPGFGLGASVLTVSLLIGLSVSHWRRRAGEARD